MKKVTRYRGVRITCWSGLYYIGENLNPMFTCHSLQDVVDFIDRHLPPI